MIAKKQKHVEGEDTRGSAASCFLCLYWSTLNSSNKEPLRCRSNTTDLNLTCSVLVMESPRFCPVASNLKAFNAPLQTRSEPHQSLRLRSPEGSEQASSLVSQIRRQHLDDSASVDLLPHAHDWHVSPIFRCRLVYLDQRVSGPIREFSPDHESISSLSYLSPSTLRCLATYFRSPTFAFHLNTLKTVSYTVHKIEFLDAQYEGLRLGVCFGVRYQGGSCRIDKSCARTSCFS